MEEARHRHPPGRAVAVILGALRVALPQVLERAVLASGWLYSVYMLVRIWRLLDVLFLVATLAPQCLARQWIHVFEEAPRSCSTCWCTWSLRFSRQALRAQGFACAEWRVCTVVASVFLSVLFTLGYRTLYLHTPCGRVVCF